MEASELVTKADLAKVTDSIARLAGLVAALAAPPQSEPTAGMARPLSCGDVDRLYKIRKGATMSAVRAGIVPAVIRRGRGGAEWPRIMPADAQRWFLAGCPGSES